MLALLLRVLLLGALVWAGYAFWRLLQPDARLKMPPEWTAEAANRPWLRDVLELRTKIVTKIIAGHAPGGDDLLADVDGVVRRLVQIADVEDHAEDLSGDAGDRLAESMEKLGAEKDEAIAWLTECYAVLVESAASDFDATVGRLHAGLEARKEALRHEVEARKEINQALERQ